MEQTGCQENTSGHFIHNLHRSIGDTRLRRDARGAALRRFAGDGGNLVGGLRGRVVALLCLIVVLEDGRHQLGWYEPGVLCANRVLRRDDLGQEIVEGVLLFLRGLEHVGGDVDGKPVDLDEEDDDRGERAVMLDDAVPEDAGGVGNDCVKA